MAETWEQFWSAYVAQLARTPTRAEWEAARRAFASQHPEPVEVYQKASRIPRELHPEWEGKTRVCPHCGKTKDVLGGFGVRQLRGEIVPSSWCRVCRSQASSRS